MRRSEVSRSVTYFDGRPLTNVRRSQSTQEFISSLPTMQLRNGPLVLGYLRELIIESDAVKVRKSRGIEEVVGLNFQHIRSRLTHSEPLRRLDILGAVMSVPSNNKFWSLSKIMSSHRPESTVLVIQLCLTHFFLDPTIDNSNSYHQEIAGIPSSQAAAHADHCRQPVFMGKYKSYANVRWILSVVRFMRYHFLESGELAGCYTALEPQLRPQAWVGRLESGTKKLGTHWKGGYIWVQDGQFVNFRRDPYNAQIDEESDGLHELSIFHDETAFPSTAWPQQFETLISTDPFPPSNSPNPLNVAALRFPLLSFFGTGRDATRPGHLFGRIHGLPLQQGIPGFQRVSFIKFCYNRAEMNLEFVDTEQIWAYEGCVLPGGRIMVGRWMHVSLDGDVLDPVDRLSGPFIYWNVDDNRADPPIFPSEALKYKELLRNTGFIN
ncbi:hypothetical protein BJ878DRAFT_194743 [Calycina marina]|uniref:Uncharacterized protein n=1 Tax=Calycina marina TaxID=1763456 RepID=A0A9P8CJB1_9HELO|nr:hypothetical protein BJ878DRAFT_194743 [Calycina marina]